MPEVGAMDSGAASGRSFCLPGRAPGRGHTSRPRDRGILALLAKPYWKGGPGQAMKLGDCGASTTSEVSVAPWRGTRGSHCGQSRNAGQMAHWSAKASANVI